MIKFENVAFSYKGEKKKIFENLCLHIKEGERVQLSAPSGKGKTTALRLITGLEKPKKGSVQIKEKAKISVVFQEDRLIPFVSAEKNISLFSDSKKAKDLLRELGLENCGDMKVDELSGGMKRRVAIARALSKEFDILLLDEAFNGLDEETLIKTCNVINRYTQGKTVILITHHQKEAQLLRAEKIEI